MNFLYSFKRSVKLGETDAAQRLYFLTPLNWCEETLEEFLDTKNYSLKKMFKGEFQTPVVNMECSIQSSAMVGDQIEIRILKIDVGRKSFKFSYELLCEGRALATASITHVCVSQKTGKSCPVPADYKLLFTS